MSSTEALDVLRATDNDSDVIGLISEFAAPVPILNVIDWPLFCWMVTSGCHAEPFQEEFQRKEWRMKDQYVVEKLREPTLTLFGELKDSIGSWSRNKDLEACIAQEFDHDDDGETVQAIVEAFQPESKDLREAGYALIAIGIEKSYSQDKALILTKEDWYVIITSESGHPHAITPEFNFVFTHGIRPGLYNPLDQVRRVVSRTNEITLIQDEWDAEETPMKIQEIFTSLIKHFTRFCDLCKHQ
jgi:hypothetical protein